MNILVCISVITIKHTHQNVLFALSSRRGLLLSLYQSKAYLFHNLTKWIEKPKQKTNLSFGIEFLYEDGLYHPLTKITSYL